ncbi:GNAT family N-acetyltransferase [Azoarcus sp. L1K30]|uniref:GNAT family N-acetyltransferase n=1 Tax=Azoarcus sp. L1K30 TaxID=2820277 RepID=UPI001B818C0C|nr:GNAT family N-acetyltransferase [Azoarcus sp. L1K30]MBR0566868.1 GNAT family N-acetyltransferase [Azoarcus sp. L1K30]
MALNVLVPGQIWHAQQALRFGPFAITTRMTVVRLCDGRLWVHSPIAPTPDLVAALDAIGPVGFVVAPNKAHHLFFLPFMQAFPAASGLIAPGLARKRPDLAGFEVIGAMDAPPWRPELHQIFIDGLPILHETAWFHAPSGTLILTDLLCCFGPDNRGLGGLAARLLGVYDRLGMSRTIRVLVRDKAALANSVDALLALEPRRIVVAHDQVIETDAAHKLAQAFAWLPGIGMRQAVPAATRHQESPPDVPALVVREFRDGEEHLLWQVMHSSVHEIARAHYAPEQLAAWAPDTWHEEAWCALMRSNRPFVAEVDGRVAGYADVQADGYIDQFFVSGHAAGRGVGSALMRRIEERARSLGLDRLRSNVSLTAQPFFRRFGFEIEAEQVVEVRGVALRNASMRKVLNTGD